MTQPTHMGLEQRPSMTRRLLIGAGFLISVIFLYLAFNNLSPAQVWQEMQAVDGGLITLAAVIYFLAVAVIAWRWQFLLAKVKPVPLLPLTRIVAIGYALNNVLPLRAGEATRVFLLWQDHRVPVPDATTVVIVERIFDGLVMLTFILVSLTVIDLDLPLLNDIIRFALPLFLVALSVFLLLAAFPNRLQGLVERVAALLPDALGQLVIRLSGGVIAGLQGLRSPLHLMGAAVTSYVTWSIEAGVYWIVMQAFGLDLSYPVALLVVGAVNLVGLIPASPGMVGTYEFTVSTLLIALGIPEDISLAYAITVHLVIWLPVTLVGFGFFGWRLWRGRPIRPAAALLKGPDGGASLQNSDVAEGGVL